MATDAYLQCSKCEYYEYPASMFEGLLYFSEHGAGVCSKCGAPRTYRFDFYFASESGKRRCRVAAAFVPSDNERPSWTEGSSVVEYFPFLVIFDQDDYSDAGVWLPYWHLKRSDEGTQTLYGQWAPFMDLELFTSLVRKARAAGYLNETAA
jgi:hypothetical protein